jgi:hypothetical protein
MMFAGSKHFKCSLLKEVKTISYHKVVHDKELNSSPKEKYYTDILPVVTDTYSWILFIGVWLTFFW